MKFAMKPLKLKRMSLSNLFVVTLVVTMIILLVCKKEVLKQTSLFSEGALEDIKGKLNGDTSGIWLIIKERIHTIVALFVMSTTSLGNIYVHMHVIWFGISSGLFLTVVLMRYGVKGILLLVAGMFPHYLIYVPVIVLTLHLTKEKRIVNHKLIGQFLIILFVVIIGCILECYVNPEVVAKILKNF